MHSYRIVDRFLECASTNRNGGRASQRAADGQERAKALTDVEFSKARAKLFAIKHLRRASSHTHTGGLVYIAAMCI